MKIRRARGADWAICRALLPESCKPTSGPIEGLILLTEDGPRVGGAAVLRFDDQDAWLGLTVVEPLRRRKLGSFIINESARLAAELGARRLLAGCDTVAIQSAEPFLLHHGFTAAARITTFDSDFPAVAPVLSRMRNELVARGRVPPSWVVTTLADAPQQAIAQLFADYIAQRQDLAEAPLRLENDGGRWSDSPVILDAGRPCAALIVEARDRIWSVEGRFVVRGYQNGVANALLLGAAADLGVARNASRFRFDARHDNRDTLKLARRLQSRTLHVKTRFERALY